MNAKISFKRDGDRYIVWWGDDRIGFVSQMDDKRWNAVDTTMEHSTYRHTRAEAGDALLRLFKRQIASGVIA
jgi:hypothetical protein